MFKNVQYRSRWKNRIVQPMLLAMALLQPAADLAADALADRWLDLGDGTVADRATGLVWLRSADALGAHSWTEAVAACAALSADQRDGLTDDSTAGDWRLPTAHELLTLTAAGLIGGRLPDDHPFAGLPARSRNLYFWTRTEGFYESQRAFRVHVHGRGGAEPADKSLALAVWAVKGHSAHLPAHDGLIPDLTATFRQLTPREQQRAEVNALFDVAGLRLKTDFVRLDSPGFLLPPDGYPGYRPIEDFRIAAESPSVALQILPNLEPEYFPEGEAYQAGWANWAAVTRGPGNRFVMAAGDHRGRGAQLNLYVYQPAVGFPGDGLPGRLERVLDVTRLLGWHADMYTDGKIHGHMDVMPDGRVWAATHHGPSPTDAWFDSGYRGAWLFSYHLDTGEAVNWGVPMTGLNMPNHRLDTQRGIFFANGSLSTDVLSWDVHTGRVLYAGSPPNGWRWHSRSTFLDPATGHFWGVETSETPFRFISFDPERNRFKRHEVPIPFYPGSDRQHAHGAWAAGPDRNGWHYTDFGGVFLRFRPNWNNGPEIETLGRSAAEERFPVLQMVMSPDQRFLYWVPRRTDTLVVKQYAIETGTKKIIGFLQGPILETYGLSIGDGVWGMNISECGSLLVILDNGGFGRQFWGHPVLLAVSIPASER